ncbi:ABC transporter permease [Halothiobacillus diazotrophicus]|uniref:ABC transporter permease n=2 Tax=Halothiobacillus diazotrophicus TaxID=1860122 RepID=A0A191ZKU4_9GAMM|nr:ABC transporter permease [Halothiobacillus diazotrophicus]
METESAVLTLSGAWTVHNLQHVPALKMPEARTIRLQSAFSGFDSSAAMVIARWLHQWRAAGIAVDVSSLPEQERTLLGLLDARLVDEPPERTRRASWLVRVGQGAMGQVDEATSFLRFLGELFWRGVPLLLMFWRIRWSAVLTEIDAAGVRALGIVGLLSFMIGMVMAYQGGATLSNYGANILLVNLVGILTLREMGPLLAAIIVAGRTGSSYTAQLGTMRITEEIDALRALGVPPFEILVFPKVVALILTLPLLSIFADLMGLLGGAVVANYGYGVSFAVYFERIPVVIGVSTLWLGLIKAPVFAIVIALIGCMQGLRVRGSAAEVGRATTVSVVQAIFMVIVIDAGFSVLYNLLGY